MLQRQAGMKGATHPCGRAPGPDGSGAHDGAEPWCRSSMEHQHFRAQIVDDLSQALQMRVDGERHLEGRSRLVQKPMPEADLAEARDGSEMTRLEFQGSLEVEQ